jgi:ribosomal protein S12
MPTINQLIRKPRKSKIKTTSILHSPKLNPLKIEYARERILSKEEYVCRLKTRTLRKNFSALRKVNYG